MFIPSNKISFKYILYKNALLSIDLIDSKYFSANVWTYVASQK